MISQNTLADLKSPGATILLSLDVRSTLLTDKNVKVGNDQEMAQSERGYLGRVGRTLQK